MTRAALPALFHPAAAEWFAETFARPTRAQAQGWPPITRGESTLVFAPTGSGKTLAAFFVALDRLMFEPPPSKATTRVLYLSPLRALAVDVERNLRVPLAGIARTAARRGDTCRPLAVAIRTGDTPQNERAKMARHPPDILITTPESLFLLLTSQARAGLASVDTVIVDEIHALVGTKRGAHLALSLERLEALTGKGLQRIGLSATARPLGEVARFLGGATGVRSPKARPVTIVDAGARKAFDLRVEVPVEDMSKMGETLEATGNNALGPVALAQRRSIWPAIHPRLLEPVRAHRSTIVFVNSRRLAERMAAALNELGAGDIARAHHGSIAREERVLIEEALKAGRLPALVATSSLELGIDMGAVDLVVQIETPPSVASGMQRIGRASHTALAVSRGIIFPKYRADLLSAAALTEAMTEGAVEETHVPKNPLDVLAQQLVALCATEPQEVDALFALVRRAAPFTALPRSQFEGVLDMLSGRYPSDDFAELRPRLTWDRLRGTVRAREGARLLAVTNAGTIPDKGLYGVFLADSTSATGAPRRVGELDEEMVFESRVGEVFVLGASSWRIAEITRDRVLVVPAPGEPGKVPFWKADRGARPVELGRRIGALTRHLAPLPVEEGVARLVERHALDARAAQNLIAYLREQKAATGVLPDDRTLVLERTRDEMGDWRMCLLSPWGGRVHAPWTLALQALFKRRGEPEVETIWSDDGIVLRLPDRERPPEARDLLPEPEEIEDLVTGELGGTALFAAHFREAASRALLLPRRRPGRRTPLWMQRKRAADLLSVAARYPSFPVVLETYRECLKDVFDLPALVDIARKVRRREIRLLTVDTEAPSPFSASLLFGYVANYLYDGDAPLAERRAHALSVDQGQLRELMGEAELRELLDAASLAELEESLRGLLPHQRLRSPDRLHDLLLRVGELSLADIAARVESADDPAPREAVARAWTTTLLAERRIIIFTLAGEERFAAAEDAARFRDGLGVEPPLGLPQAFLEPVSHALRDLVARYARTHGPFHPEDAARRLGCGTAPVESALRELLADGRLILGEFRPGGSGREWVSPDVLTSLRQRSLAKLRREVAPAEPVALARTLLDWQGIASGPTSRRGGPDALLDVIEQLEGAAFPASDLERDILPARLPGYRPADLDALCAAGEVIWVGRAPLGDRDGRLSLYLADDLWLLHEPRADPPKGDLHDKLRAHLALKGASFFADLMAAAGGGLERSVLDALWDLVWSGEVTNDTPAALRAFLRLRASGRSPGDPRWHRLQAFRSRRQISPSSVGRWSLLKPPPGRTPPPPTERLLARAEQLLARHGVLTRAAVAAEEVPGGFAAVYPVLRTLEESGRIRRGYFVRGLGGTQFAQPGALERLRALRDPSEGDEDEAARAGVVLAAADPANPYGATLPWPPGEGARPLRAAGTHVVLVDGALAAYLGRGEKELRTFVPTDEPQRSRVLRALALALAGWAKRSARSLLGCATADAQPIAHSALAPFLLGAGFVRSGPGYRYAGPGPAAAATTEVEAGGSPSETDPLGQADDED